MDLAYHYFSPIEQEFVVFILLDHVFFVALLSMEEDLLGTREDVLDSLRIH